MFIENELKKVINVPKIDEYRNGCVNLIGEILIKFLDNKKIFELDNFSAMYYDEYTLKTNCHNDIFSVMYLEIDQPSNFKPSKKISNKPESDKIKFPELYFDLDKILEELYTLLVQNLDSNYLIWYDQTSVCIKYTALENDTTTRVYYFKIIPAITYYNKNNVKGIMYRANGGIEIEYPDISIKNFNKKNKKTKGIFREIVTMIKNIMLQQKDVTKLPKEIIEILLYNAPNEMFVDTSKKTILSIINFLRNNSIKNFKTMDEEDFAFVSKYRSMSPIYVKHTLKLIEKFLISN